jgi:hypothetical protein
MPDSRNGLLIAAMWLMLLPRAATASSGEPDRPIHGERLRPTGQRYKAVVPDTLDLAERAEWGANALTGCADPHADFEIYRSERGWRSTD